MCVRLRVRVRVRARVRAGGRARGRGRVTSECRSVGGDAWADVLSHKRNECG
jgi:hypothetical protein